MCGYAYVCVCVSERKEKRARVSPSVRRVYVCMCVFVAVGLNWIFHMLFCCWTLRVSAKETPAECALYSSRLLRFVCV